MSTETVVTQHGEVEYETVECDSCSNSVKKGEELSYVVGDISSSSYWSHKNQYEVRFNEAGFDKGNLCPHCAEARNLHIEDYSNSKYYNSANTVGSILKGVRNAHSRYVEKMIENLNAEKMMGGYGEPDIMGGLLYLSMYICVILMFVMFAWALI